MMTQRIDTDRLYQAAQGHWRDILTAYGAVLPRHHHQHGPCPMCGGKDRFRFDDQGGRGTWICNQCGAGPGMTLFLRLTGYNYPAALEAVAQWLGMTNEPRRQPKPAPGLRVVDTTEPPTFNRRAWQQFKAIQAAALPIEGTPVERYLNQRGIYDAATHRPPAPLGYHPALEYWEDGQLLGEFPAMVAPVQDPAGQVVTLHRTYLTDHGHKAPVPKPRKLLTAPRKGATRGGAVRLFPPTADGMLALAEGIETALSVTLATGIPCWATISAGGLERIQLPPNVTSVLIMADKDRSGTGQRAASAAGARLLAEGRKVQISMPRYDIPDHAKSLDWLDVYNQIQAGAVNE